MVHKEIVKQKGLFSIRNEQDFWHEGGEGWGQDLGTKAAEKIL